MYTLATVLLTTIQDENTILGGIVRLQDSLEAEHSSRLEDGSGSKPATYILYGSAFSAV